jgi:AcrR family transcriptional regulator
LSAYFLDMASLSTPLPDNPLLEGRAPRAGRENADRGQQIIDAAYDLLEEDGLEGLTIRAVLKRTGLARRAFYERFAGKDDLVLAVFAQALMQSAVFLRQEGRALDGPLERIRLIVSTLLRGALGEIEGVDGEAHDRRSAAFSREHLRLADARPADLQAALSPLLDLMTEVMADGIASGAFRACDPALQARLLYNLVATTLHTELLAEAGARLERRRRAAMADEIWEFCYRAIAA